MSMINMILFSGLRSFSRRNTMINKFKILDRSFGILSLLLVILGLMTQGVRSETKFLVVANGDWNLDLVKQRMPGKTVIALDGAGKHFYEAGLVHHYILGDLDSIAEDSNAELSTLEALVYFSARACPDDSEVVFEEYTGNTKDDRDTEIAYVRAKSQNYTGLDKGIQFCLKKAENAFVEIDVLCALGGKRLDHLLGNLSVLKKYHGNGRTIRFIDSLQTIQYADDQSEKQCFKGNIGEKVGVFGWPSAIVESTGLKWNLSDAFPLDIGIQESSCNEFADDEVHIKVIKGSALIIMPNHD